MNKNTSPSLPLVGFIRLSTVVQFVPYSHSTIWRKIKSGDFPAPVKLSSNITAWKAEDVRAWLDSAGG